MELNLAIKLPCGRMRLRRVPSCITQEELEEGAFGRRFLKALGVRLDNPLCAARVKLDNANAREPLQKKAQSLSVKRPSSPPRLRRAPPRKLA